MMNLKSLIKKLFRKDKRTTIGDVLDHDYTDVHVTTVGGRTFKRLWAVHDMDNGYAIVADGFETKGQARTYCETVDFNWYMNPYTVEI